MIERSRKHGAFDSRWPRGFESRRPPSSAKPARATPPEDPPAAAVDVWEDEGGAMCYVPRAAARVTYA